MADRPAECGPLRPPSEARSLLVRVVRNCPWNRCAFCPAYKGERFSLRPVEDVVADLERLSREPGADRLTSAFLQDADALILPVERLEVVLRELRRRFPALERVTTYARSHTLTHRTVDQLARLRAAGLTRVHVGVESGCDAVLELVRKGVTAAAQLEGCRRVRPAGLELCTYVMPGLGGARLSERNAADTGAFVAALEPDHVRLRTCVVLEGTPLADLHAAGAFEPLDEEGTVREIRGFLEQLRGARTELVSDHRINLLLELHGELPEDGGRLIAIVDRFLGLSPEDRRLFVAGRRLGLLKLLDELREPGVRERVARQAHRWRPVVPWPRDVLY